MENRSRTEGDSSPQRAFLPRLMHLGFLVLLISVHLTACRNTATLPDTISSKEDAYLINGQWYYPISESAGFQQKGIASWYGDPFHGRKTASGETYDMHANTAAHKTLPLGTFVLVKNLDNRKETIVRINDRGPFVHGRVIDLSFKAADAIDMIDRGTAPVEIVALAKEPDSAAHNEPGQANYYTGDFTVQIGAFSSRERALELQEALEANFTPVTVSTTVRGDTVLYRVRVGQFTSLAAAEATEAHLIQTGYSSAFAVARED